jgi:hypothetical protein
VEDKAVGSPFWGWNNLFEKEVKRNSSYPIMALVRRYILKAVMEIIIAVIFLVGLLKILEETLLALRKESLRKVYRGLPSLEKFTTVLTKKYFV